MSAPPEPNEDQSANPLEPDSDDLTIDEFVDFYAEFRLVLHNKEKQYPDDIEKTPINSAIELFKIWFMDMVDRQIMANVHPPMPPDEQGPSWQ